MENLDLIILTIIVSASFLTFGVITFTEFSKVDEKALRK